MAQKVAMVPIWTSFGAPCKFPMGGQDPGPTFLVLEFRPASNGTIRVRIGRRLRVAKR